MLAPILALSLIVAQSDDGVGDVKALLQLEQGAADEATLLRLVDQTLPRVARVMGVRAPGKVKTKVISREQASRRILQILEREYPGDKLERLQTLLQLVHMVGAKVDLAGDAHEMYSQHVSGFYDHSDHTLYLLQDQPMMVQGLIVAHELAHALQDEKLGLERAIRERQSSEDAQLALSAALEGNAQAVASAMSASELSDALEGADLGDMMTEGTADSTLVAAQASKAAPWLALQLSFPYVAGAGLVKALRSKEDPAATAKLLSRFPASTAQVLDPELYKTNQKPLQGQIGLARLLGAEPLYETTLGRANVELFGTGVGAGWRGDRAEAVSVNGKPCAAWVIAFRSASQASRFISAYAEELHTSGNDSSVRINEPDGTLTKVSRSEGTVVILSHVPPDKAQAIEEAALSALR